MVDYSLETEQVEHIHSNVFLNVLDVLTNVMTPGNLRSGIEIDDLIHHPTKILNITELTTSVINGQVGGDATLENIPLEISKIAMEINKCNIVLEKHYDLLMKYIVDQVRKINYMIYLVLIATSFKIIPCMMHYIYMTFGTLDFYLAIIDEILNKIHDKIQRVDIVYFSQNHYIILVIP